MKQLSTHAASVHRPKLLEQQLSWQLQCVNPTAEGSPSLAATQQWSLVRGPQSWPQSDSHLGSQLGLPGLTPDTDSPPAALQYPIACPDATSVFGLPSLSTAEVDTWTSDYPPDVDQLLDWAADPELPLSLSKVKNTPSAFSMSGSPGPDYNLQLGSSQSMEGFHRQLSCSWDTQSSGLDAHGYVADMHPQAESYSDALACSLLPGLEAMDDAASQLLLPSSDQLVTAQSSGHDSQESEDPLDQLLESACCLLPQAVGQSPSAVPVLGMGHNPAGPDSSQAGVCEDRQGPQKKRCGRPRVYDLDTPVATGGACSHLDAHVLCGSCMCASCVTMVPVHICFAVYKERMISIAAAVQNTCYRSCGGCRALWRQHVVLPVVYVTCTRSTQPITASCFACHKASCFAISNMPAHLDTSHPPPLA